MEETIKYGNTSAYKYHLDDVRMDAIVKITNRSTGQTQFLFNLVGGDFNKLLEIEEKIKNNHLGYCPGTEEDAGWILRLREDGGMRQWSAHPSYFWLDSMRTKCPDCEGKGYVVVPFVGKNSCDTCKGKMFI